MAARYPLGVLDSVDGEAQAAAPPETRDAPPGRAGGWRTARPLMAWGGALLVAAAVLFWCYLRESQTAPVNSDGSSDVLQGWDMLHGNLLLSGWWLSDVSFYTFEVPINALVTGIHGLNPDALHISAALVYTLLVLAAAMVGRGTARGAEGVTRAVIAAGIMLAPAISPGARVLMLSPDHVGVGVPILLTLLLVDRVRERLWVPAAMCVLLVWAQLDDPLAIIAVAVPLAVVCLARACLPFLRLGRVAWYDFWLAVAAAVSVELTRLAVSAIKSAGGYSMQPLGLKLVAASHWPAQLHVLGENVLILFGADFFDQPPGIRTVIAFVHFAGIVLAACGLAIGIAGLVRGGDRVTQTLTVGLLLTLAAGTLVIPMILVSNAHEIAVVLPFGAVIAGRTLGPLLAGRRLRASLLVRFALIPLLGASLACYLAVLGYNASQPARPAQTQELADWLMAHHFTRGLGTYWAGSSTTLASGGKVVVAPMQDGAKIAHTWVTKPSWYDPASSYANFVIAAPGQGNAIAFSEASVRHTFGKPSHVYPVGMYVIMVWNKNLLLQVPKPVQG
jgi:hypothetical protein